MKKALLVFVGLVATTSLAWTGIAIAANVRSGDAPRVTSNETIDGTLYAAGNIVTIEGRIQGDLICGAQEVDISGVVEGDVLCAAQQITISGEVQGDIRSAAQQVRIEGKVAGSVSIVGQQVDIAAGGSVGRDATIIAQQALVNGMIGRDVEIISETFYANGTLGRHVEVTGVAVSLGDKATIAGNFMYISSADATVSSTATIAGTTEHKIPATPATPSTQSYLASMLISLASFITLGMALLLVSPRFMRTTTSVQAKSPLLTLGAGVAGLILPPFVGGILLLSVVGAPIAALLILGWIASLICGLVVSAQTLGQMLVKKLGWNSHIALLVGLAAIFAAGLIPYVGVLVLTVATIWGVGAQWYVGVMHRNGELKAAKKE